MTTPLSKSPRDAAICAELTTNFDVEVSVDVADYFRYLSPAERREYLDFEPHDGAAEFEKPAAWLCRVAEETDIRHCLAGPTEIAETNFDVTADPWSGRGRAWTETAYAALIAEVAWLRENDADVEPADTLPKPRRTSATKLKKSPTGWSFEIGVFMRTKVDFIAWAEELPQSERAIALGKDADFYDHYERPYAHMVNVFAESIEAHVPFEPNPHVLAWVSEPSVEDKISYRHSTTTFGRATTWTEDDFETASAAVPWILDTYLAWLVDEDIDDHHPDYVAYIDYLERVARIPGPRDVPLFNVA